MEKGTNKSNLVSSRKLFEEVFANFGIEGQKYLFFEETGELMKAISQYERASGTKNMNIRRNKIASAIANVTIMLSQLKVIYAIDEHSVNSYIDSQLDALDYELQQKLYNRDRKLTIAQLYGGAI